MEDVNISKYRASVVREGSKPASPGFVVSEGQSPTDPAGTGQNHLPVTIAAASTALSITESQILSGAGTVSQYIRGDGSLADFPEASGGGSSISYYLNGSINQGTIGGVAYKELSKVPILGAGTDFSISADGYIASFLTDAGDPNLLEIPGGNWNFETYFSSSSSGGTPTFYVELYKYDGTTFTLIASNSSSPEFIAFGTTLTAYFSTLAVPTTTLALTDRLAVRYYVTHSGRTITLHTENNHLCQIITTFTTGLTALNGLTAQVQNFATGTTGTDFNIASATATHTFNLPTASATNRGALSSADWSTFNNKENAITAGTTAQYFRGDKTFQTLNTSVVPELTNLYYTEARVNANTNVAANTAARHNAVTLGTANGLSLSTQVLSLGLASAGVTGALSGTDWTTFNNKQNALGYTPVPETRTITINGTTQDLSANRTFNVGTVTSVGLSSATSGVTIGSTPVTGSGTITLAIATASGSQNGLLSSTDWTTFNNKASTAQLANYLPLAGGTLTGQLNGTSIILSGDITANKYRGVNSLVLNTYTTVNPSSNVYLYSPGNDRDAWIYLDSADTASNWGIYHRQIDSTVAGLPGNSIGFIGNGNNTLQAYINLINGDGYFRGNLSGANLSGTNTGNVTIGTANGLSLSGQQLSLGLASGSLNGALSSTDWTTFNSKQNALTNPVTGTGTTNYLPKFTGASTIGNSQIFDNGTNVGIGTPIPSSKLEIVGDAEMLNLRNSTTSTITGRIGVRTDGAIQIYSFQSGVSYKPVIFGVDGSFTSAGNLLVGTTTDNGARLNVTGNTYISADLRFGTSYSGASNNTAIVKWQDGSASIPNSLGIFTWADARDIQIGGNNVYFRTEAGVNRMIITSSGNVFVNSTSGYTNTGRIGVVVNGSTQAIFGLQTGGVNKAYLYNDGSNTLLYSEDGSGYMGFGTANTERMRITSGGNVLIGTATDSGYRFTIGGSGQVFGTSMSGGGVDFYSSGNFAPHYQTDYTWYTGAFGSGTQRMQLNSSGNLQVNASIRSGFANTSALLVQSNGTATTGAAIAIQQLTGEGDTIIFGDYEPYAEYGIIARNSLDSIDFTGGTTTNSLENYNITNRSGNTRTAYVKARIGLGSGISYFGGNVLIGSTTDNGSKLQVNGAIRTAQPVGTTSNGWLLGRALVSGTSTPDRWIRVQIGLEYYDILAVYMGTL